MLAQQYRSQFYFCAIMFLTMIFVLKQNFQILLGSFGTDQYIANILTDYQMSNLKLYLQFRKHEFWRWCIVTKSSWYININVKNRVIFDISSIWVIPQSLTTGTNQIRPRAVFGYSIHKTPFIQYVEESSRAKQLVQKMTQVLLYMFSVSSIHKNLNDWFNQKLQMCLIYWQTTTNQNITPFKVLFNCSLSHLSRHHLLFTIVQTNYPQINYNIIFTEQQQYLKTDFQQNCSCWYLQKMYNEWIFRIPINNIISQLFFLINITFFNYRLLLASTNISLDEIPLFNQCSPTGFGFQKDHKNQSNQLIDTIQNIIFQVYYDILKNRI
ncbi:Hypothetical_protein [Hexamita inflata]|uniref:Hypothetical_protein n=1 Tax=Hexamita inflata TaxID=28002 RepID=A0AA86P399_9EUKA|nr:Hypothetical protein HINF_LOCUS18709 [Hexamita inflata]